MKPINFRNSWSSIRMADDGQPATIALTGLIGGGWFGEDGTTYDDFTAALDAIPQDREIVMRVNSEGGSIFVALGIFSRLLERRNNLTAKIEGMALSAASWVPAAAKRVETSKYARWFLHGAQALVIGGSEDLRDVANQLDEETDNIATLLADHRGRSKDEWLDMMAADTWLTGQAAVDEGLADGLIEAPSTSSNRFPVNRLRRFFINVPDSLPPGGVVRGRNSTPANSVNTTMAQPTTPPANAAPAAPAAQPAPANTTPPAPAAAAPAPAAPVVAVPVVAVPSNGANPPDANLATLITAMNAQTERMNRFLETVERSQQSALPGTDPLPRPGVQNLGNPLIEEYRRMKPGEARNAFRVQNHGEIIRVATSVNPANANTISTSLLTDYLSDALIVVATNRLTALSLFARDFGTDRIAPYNVVQVRKFSSGSAAVVQTSGTGISNYESGDSTVDNIPVTVKELSKSFHVTNTEMNSGSRLAHLAEGSARIFANAISDQWTALLKAATYGTALTIGAASNFDADDLRPILAAAKNFDAKNLVLDGGHLAYLLPKDKNAFRLGEQGAYGFDLIAEQNRWTGADSNTAGFVCSPNAIALASGLPVALPAEEFLSLGTVVIPGVNLTVQTATWFSRASRTFWSSFDVMLGAAAGDTTQAEVLITA